MAKLILSMDGLVLKEFSLDKERISIGRKPHNDIQIDNLAISGEHAVIITLLGDSFLEDLNSTNGTYINGQAVKKHFLQDGDVIELGKYRLKYLADQTQIAGVAGNFPKSGSVRSDLVRKAAEHRVERSLNDTQPDFRASDTAVLSNSGSGIGADAPSAMIEILNGTNAGRILGLTKTLTTLGKPGVQVAVILKRQQGYFVTHVEGTSMPSVSGKPIEINRPQLLNDQDIIELGGVRMKFFYKH